MVQSVIGLFLYRLLAFALLLFSLCSFPVSFPVGWMGGWLDKLTKLSEIKNKPWSQNIAIFRILFEYSKIFEYLHIFEYSNN